MTYGSSQTDKIVLLRPNFRPNMDEKLSCQHTPPPLSPPADEDHAIALIAPRKDSKASLSAFKKKKKHVLIWRRNYCHSSLESL